VQAEVAVHPAFGEAVLVLDESAEAKGGGVSVGAGRQYNGRLGKVDQCQVGVFAALVTPQAWLWVDGELYLPAHWFRAEQAGLRKRVGLPTERQFQTKPELGWQLIQRLRQRGIPFTAVAMDDLYGRNTKLCQQLDKAGIEYYGDIPANTTVYLDCPKLASWLTKRGKVAKRKRIVAQQRYQVRQLVDHPQVEWLSLTLRATERGYLTDRWGRCRVWLVDGDRRYQRWLLIRDTGRQLTFSLSNASVKTSLETMAWRKAHRVFIECGNHNSKSDLGWDDLQAIKYRAWQHQLALTILASWFVAETRLDWQARFEHDPALLAQYETELLPLLSVGNVRTLLRAALPLRQLTPEEATNLVIEQLTNRTRSRQARLNTANPPET
jgi:SRSO17 transposase